MPEKERQIEDAIILGCDAINLYLGTKMSGFSDAGDYEAVMESLEKSDAVVAMAAGNEGYAVGNAANSYYLDDGYLYADDVFTSTIGSPGSYTNSMCVASVDNAKVTMNGFFTVNSTTKYDYVVSGNADGSETTYTCPKCGDSYTETAEASNAKFTVSETKGAVGDTVEVTVSIANNPGLIMAQFSVDYDASILKLVEVKDAGMFDSFSVDGNVVTLGSLNEIGDTTTDGTVVTLVFEITADVNETTEVGISYANGAICNYNGESLIFAIDNGTVEVYNYLLGDVNRDGVVDIKDVS